MCKGHKICGPCTHQRPLHLFSWPLHISKWPLHPFLFTGFVALAHGPCTSSRGPCTGPCPRKMSLFGRLSGSAPYLNLRSFVFNINCLPINGKPFAVLKKLILQYLLSKPKKLQSPICIDGKEKCQILSFT